MRRLKFHLTMRGSLPARSLRSRDGSVILKQPLNPWLAAVCIALAAPALPALAQTSPAAAQQEDELDAALQLYRARLLQTAQRRRSYPAEALEQRITGTVNVEITVSGDGRLKQKRLLTSSSHGSLDTHALQLLEEAAPLTEVPSALKGRAFRVPVTVNYVLPE